jgi:GT2 family glycosyltransferase
MWHCHWTILFHERPDRIWFYSGKFHPITRRVEHAFFNEIGHGQMLMEPISFISGCSWLIPPKTFNNIGLINEECLMYVEVLEFCQRVLSCHWDSFK